MPYKCKERAREYRRQWIKNNPGKTAEYTRRQRRKHLHARIRTLLGNRLRKALRHQGKRKSTFEMCGCTWDELRAHIESQFVDGMSWDNHGEWHIDHIIPCASFDLSNPEEQLQCFHYTNLQPLWAADNLSKGASLVWP